MKPTAAPAIFPYPDHRTVAEVWGLKPEQKLDTWLRPVPAIAPRPNTAKLIDLRNAPSSMEMRAAGWSSRFCSDRGEASASQ